MTDFRLLAPDTRILDRKTGTIRLFFPAGSRAADGHYTMRGGISWPCEVKGTEGLVYGYAAVCGRHEESGAVYVFEETDFYLIESYREDAAGNVQKFPALGPWMMRQWATYLCYQYFVHQPELTSHFWRGQILRARDLVPKPAILEAEWAEDGTARAVLTDLAERGRLSCRPGRVSEALKRLAFEDGLPDAPEMRAVTCACVGLARARVMEVA